MGEVSKGKGYDDQQESKQEQGDGWALNYKVTDAPGGASCVRSCRLILRSDRPPGAYCYIEWFHEPGRTADSRVIRLECFRSFNPITLACGEIVNSLENDRVQILARDWVAWSIRDDFGRKDLVLPRRFNRHSVP